MEIWPLTIPHGYTPNRTYAHTSNQLSNTYSVLEHRLGAIEKNNETLPKSVRMKLFWLRTRMGIRILGDSTARKYLSARKIFASIDVILDKSQPLKGLFVTYNGKVYLDTADIKISASPSLFPHLLP